MRAAKDLVGLSFYTGLSKPLLQDKVIILTPHVSTDMYFIVCICCVSAWALMPIGFFFK